MAPLVWFTTGVAIWHFTVFLPDRFWGGIVGALLGATAGAMITGAIAQIVTGQGIGETGIETVIYAIPGTLLGSRRSTRSAPARNASRSRPEGEIPSGRHPSLGAWRKIPDDGSRSSPTTMPRPEP